MYGLSTYASSTLAYSPATTAAAAQDAIVFNGYSLQSATVITSEIDYDDRMGIEINAYNFTRGNGGAILTKYYRGRDIKLKSLVKSTTAAGLASLIDALKQNLSQTDGYLEVTMPSGEIRRIRATCSSMVFARQSYNVTFCPVEIAFRTLEPFFYAKTVQATESSGLAAPASVSIVHAGTAPTEPIVSLEMTSIYTVYLSISDGTHTITVHTSITPWDLIIVDSKAKTVTQNGNAIAYTGTFLKFVPGTNTVTITASGGSASFDAIIACDNTYL